MLLRVKVLKGGEEIASIVLERDIAYKIADFLRRLGHDVTISMK